MKHVTLLFLLTVLTISMACKKKTTPADEPLPDLVVAITASEGGATLAAIDFTAVEQEVSNATCNGSYNSNAGMFAMTAVGQVGQAGPNFTFNGPTGGVLAAKYDVTTGNFISAFNTTSEAFVATSGYLEITTVDEYAAAAGVTEYFIDGEVDMTMENNDGTRTITVTGTFSGVNIKSN